MCVHLYVNIPKPLWRLTYYFIHKIVVGLFKYWLSGFKWKEIVVEFEILSNLNSLGLGVCTKYYMCTKLRAKKESCL